MRIAVNTRFLLKDKLEGIGRYTFEVMKRMVLDHPEDEFYFLFDRPFDPAYIFAKNVKGVVISPPARHPILWWWWFSISLPRALKKLNVDVFFSPDGYNCQKKIAPTAMVIHDLAYLHYPKQVPKRVLNYYRKYTPPFIANADKIISVSNFVKQDILRHFPNLAKNKVSPIHNACSDKFKALPENEKAMVRAKFSSANPYLFFVGAIHPRKNVQRIIEAFDIFSDKFPNYNLLIAGRNAWKTKEIEDSFKASKNKEKIKFLGFVSEFDLPRIMASAEIFLYPSLFEGFGIPVLEAFHSEVPVITSNLSSMPEVAGDAAILVDPNSITDIEMAMTRLASQPELRQKLIAKGKIQRDKFSWDRASKSIYEIIQSLKTA